MINRRSTEVSAARREFGRYPERLRTWPGSRRSGHPEVSFCAWGPVADELLAEPADGDPWGTDGPLGRLVQRDGQVIMIGAPLKTLTLCHHAEAIARVDGRRFREYEMPVRRDTGTEWVRYRTMDTFYGALPYWDRPDLAVDSPAGKLSEQAVAAGATAESMINDCPLVLVDAPAAVRAAVAWIEDAFGSGKILVRDEEVPR